MNWAPVETVESLGYFHWVFRRRQDWTLLGLRALEDATVPQFWDELRRQRKSGSSLAIEGLSRRIVEVELLMQWLQSYSAMLYIKDPCMHTIRILLQLQLEW